VRLLDGFLVYNDGIVIVYYAIVTDSIKRARPMLFW